MDANASEHDTRTTMIAEIVDDEVLSTEFAAWAKAYLADDRRAAAAAKRAQRVRELEMGINPLPSSAHSARLRFALTDARELTRAFGWRGIAEILSVCIDAIEKVTVQISQSLSRLVERVKRRARRVVTRCAVSRHHLVYVSFPPRRAAQSRDFAAKSAA